MVKNKIAQILKANNFVPIRYLQGEAEYNYLGLPGHSNRLFNKKESVLIEGRYLNKPAVLKMIVAYNNNALLFKRELYAYRILAKKQFLIRKLIPKYYFHSFDPCPYVIIEKANGEKFGDWYQVQDNAFELIKQCLSRLKTLHQSISLPKYIAYPIINREPNILFMKLIKQLAITDYQNKLRLTDYLRTKLPQAQSEWKKARKGFSYGDFSLSNVIVNKGSIKFIDWENIGNAVLGHDHSLLIFAAIGSKIEKSIVNLCQYIAKDNKQLELLNFLVLYQVVKNISKFSHKDKNKFLNLSGFIDRQIN